MAQTNSSQHDSAVERVNLRIKENKESITFCEKIKSDVSGLEYNKDTRNDIKALAESLQKKYSDFRSAMLKDCKKKDLIETIIKVCDRTIQIENERMESNKADLEKFVVRENESKKRAEYRKFIERIEPYENEYVKGFDSVREGIRQWDCIISCVEDGIIHEGNILEYGIDLSVPPEK